MLERTRAMAGDDLTALLAQATGSDRALDGALARLLDPGASGTPPDYTASVDRAVELVQSQLPGLYRQVSWNDTRFHPYAN